MTFLFQLICAVFPVIILGSLFYHRGLNASVTKKRLRSAFGWGCSSVFIVTFVNNIVECFVDLEAKTCMNILWKSAFPEELVKIIIMMFLINRYQIKRTLDILLICGSVGLGFACLENIFYVIFENDAMFIAILRATTAIPDHFVYSIIMGYFISKVINQSNGFKSKTINILIAFCVPVFIHWSMNLYSLIGRLVDINAFLFLLIFPLRFLMPTIFVIYAFKYIKKVRAREEEIVPSQNQTTTEQDYDSERHDIPPHEG